MMALRKFFRANIKGWSEGMFPPPKMFCDRRKEITTAVPIGWDALPFALTQVRELAGVVAGVVMVTAEVMAPVVVLPSVVPFRLPQLFSELNLYIAIWYLHTGMLHGSEWNDARRLLCLCLFIAPPFTVRYTGFRAQAFRSGYPFFRIACDLFPGNLSFTAGCQ